MAARCPCTATASSLEFQLLVAQGYAVVYSNPRGSTGYGRTFSGAVLNDWGGKDYRRHPRRAGRGARSWRHRRQSARRRGRQLRRLHDQLGRRPQRPLQGRRDDAQRGRHGDVLWHQRHRLGASPWTNSAPTPGTEPERLASSRRSPTSTNIHTPLLILHSDNDLRCPIAEAEQLFTALKYLGRETEFVRLRGAEPRPLAQWPSALAGDSLAEDSGLVPALQPHRLSSSKEKTDGPDWWRIFSRSGPSGERPFWPPANYRLLLTLLKIEERRGPSRTSAAITTMATSAMIRAYSTRP